MSLFFSYFLNQLEFTCWTENVSFEYFFNLYGKGVDAPVRRIPRSSDHLATTHPLERHSSQTKKSLNILTSSRPRTKKKFISNRTHTCRGGNSNAIIQEMSFPFWKQFKKKKKKWEIKAKGKKNNPSRWDVYLLHTQKEATPRNPAEIIMIISCQTLGQEFQVTNTHARAQQQLHSFYFYFCPVKTSL